MIVDAFPFLQVLVEWGDLELAVTDLTELLGVSALLNLAPLAYLFIGHIDAPTILALEPTQSVRRFSQIKAGILRELNLKGHIGPDSCIFPALTP